MLPSVNRLGQHGPSARRAGQPRSETTRRPSARRAASRSAVASGGSVPCRRRPAVSPRRREAQRAMTVSPPPRAGPWSRRDRHSGGTKTSIREPNFISPIRWPVASRLPGPMRVTIRRASSADDLPEDDASRLAVDAARR